MKMVSLSSLAGLCLSCLIIHSASTARACSILVLTDGERALFANNEDWSDPHTRIWFVPGVEGRYGCAYVGFRNHWAQGGLNTEGVAFDWVAGYKESYQPDAQLRPVTGNPSQRMLETCTTVEDVIRYYQTYQEPSFSYARILVADKSGASVIIRAREGRLQFDKTNCSRGFGYAGRTIESLLATNPPPSPICASRILRSCVQTGTYATKYSNVFDLRSGEIFLRSYPEEDRDVKLSLTEELRKGEHYYDLPKISRQITQGPRHWPSAAGSQSIPDKEPKTTARIRALLQDGIDGKMRAEDYAPQFWTVLAPTRESITANLKSFGDLLTMTLVDRDEEADKRVYWYRLEFQKRKLLQRFVLDPQNRLQEVEVEDSQE